MTQEIKITDSHCHLDFPDFDAERDQVIERALETGVHRMVTICTKLRLLPQVQAIAEAHPSVYFAAGTHPMSAAEEPMVRVDELRGHRGIARAAPLVEPRRRRGAVRLGVGRVYCVEFFLGLPNFRHTVFDISPYVL